MMETHLSAHNKRAGRSCSLPHSASMATLLLLITLSCQVALSLKHHLVLTDDHRISFTVSSFGYLLGGRLDVIVQNLTLTPDPSEDPNYADPQFGFVLIRSDQANHFLVDPSDNRRISCMLNNPRSFISNDVVTMSLDPASKKVLLKCTGDNKLPSIDALPGGSTHKADTNHGSSHHYTKRDATVLASPALAAPLLAPSEAPPVAVIPHRSGVIIHNRTLSEIASAENRAKSNAENKDEFAAAPIVPPEAKHNSQHHQNFQLHKCHKSEDLPLYIVQDEFGRRSYSFNFTMFIRHEYEEAIYYLTFQNCLGRRGPIGTYNRHNAAQTTTIFNLSTLIYETNYPENYLSAGSMPLPQMYFIFSVLFFLIGCVWLNFIARQKDRTLKIHHLMTALVFAKACSLLFHGMNNHYIALNGQPVVAWAYLYYATRAIKGALFFITLVLIGSGWSFVKHILSDKDKKIILFVVGLQVIAHIAVIALDESVEGEATNEFWIQLCSLVDLASCIAILYPISWSVRHLEEASRTDGKAAINLKKLELFKRFYIISVIYIYVTRIVSFIFLPWLSHRYSWLSGLVFEATTLTYFIVTGYYFQPMPTNPYLLLSSDNNDLDEDILFSLDGTHMLGGTQMNDLAAKQSSGTESTDRNALLVDAEGTEGPAGKQRLTRRLIEDIV